MSEIPKQCSSCGGFCGGGYGKRACQQETLAMSDTEVKRYSMDWHQSPDEPAEPIMLPDKRGEFVAYGDYADLQRQLEAKQHAIDAAKAQIVQLAERRTMTDEHIHIISNAIRGAGLALIDKSVAKLIEPVAKDAGKKVNVSTIEDRLRTALDQEGAI